MGALMEVESYTRNKNWAESSRLVVKGIPFGGYIPIERCCKLCPNRLKRLTGVEHCLIIGTDTFPQGQATLICRHMEKANTPLGGIQECQ